jgi:hypothetical protein
MYTSQAIGYHVSPSLTWLSSLWSSLLSSLGIHLGFHYHSEGLSLESISLHVIALQPLIRTCCVNPNNSQKVPLSVASPSLLYLRHFTLKDRQLIYLTQALHKLNDSSCYSPEDLGCIPAPLIMCISLARLTTIDRHLRTSQPLLVTQVEHPKA